MMGQFYTARVRVFGAILSSIVLLFALGVGSVYAAAPAPASTPTPAARPVQTPHKASAGTSSIKISPQLTSCNATTYDQEDYNAETLEWHAEGVCSQLVTSQSLTYYVQTYDNVSGTWNTQQTYGPDKCTDCQDFASPAQGYYTYYAAPNTLVRLLTFYYVCQGSTYDGMFGTSGPWEF